MSSPTWLESGERIVLDGRAKVRRFSDDTLEKGGRGRLWWIPIGGWPSGYRDRISVPITDIRSTSLVKRTLLGTWLGVETGDAAYWFCVGLWWFESGWKLCSRDEAAGWQNAIAERAELTEFPPD